MKYKLRLFYPSVVLPFIATGKIEIRNGSKDYVLSLLRDKLDKVEKVIIEVV